MLIMKNKIFLDSIIGLAEQAPIASTEMLRDAILQYGSETPDNIEAVKHLAIQEDDFAKGVGTTGGILASRVINMLEESSIPTEVKAQYPELSKKEWEAVLRYCTLVISALEVTP